MSKAALVRLFVGERLKPPPQLSADPIRRMAGADDFERFAEKWLAAPESIARPKITGSPWRTLIEHSN
jgi:hypothetical protein